MEFPYCFLHGDDNMKEIEIIKNIAIDIVKATSKILNDAEVVLVDHNGYYIGFNESYLQRKKTGEWKPYIDTVIKNKQVTVIECPGFNPLCKGCSNEGHCPQTLEIIVPFNIEDKYLGYISIITFSEETKAIYLAKKEQVIEFLKTLINVMVSSGKEHFSRIETENALEQLNIIIQHMDYVAFTCDSDGSVQCANQSFYDFFNLPSDKFDINTYELFKSSAIETALSNGEGFDDMESVIIFNDVIHRMVVSCKAIKDEEGEATNFTFFIRTIEDARRFMSNVPTPPPDNTLSQIVGKSNEITELKNKIRSFSQSISTILIRGETGTGKELVARSLHSLSPRSEKPFITINCAAIPDSLLESELFGYEEGTFTGASKGGKAGLFELGNNGTVFLDEIGDMPLHLQAKLLRVLQEKQVIRLGGFHPIDLDVRIIAATNHDLEKLVQEKRFRSDLFYRLNILPINIPPLRNRISDLDQLVFHFIDKYNVRLNKNILGIESDFLELLKSYRWPGNVRELENAIEYAINLEEGSYLTKKHCTPEISKYIHRVDSPKLKEQLQEYEISIIRNALQQNNKEKDSVNTTARALGISRASLYKKIKDYNITIN